MIWETFWRHKRSENQFRILVCLSANFEMHNLASVVQCFFLLFSDLEHLDPFKNNKRVSLIKKVVLKPLGDEIWPTLCPVKGSASMNGWLQTAILRFLLFPVSPVSGFFRTGSVSEIPVRFPVSGSVHKFPETKVGLCSRICPRTVLALWGSGGV